MILLAHPFGNANVRAVLRALAEAQLLEKFITTLAWPNESTLASLLPANWRRRGYDLARTQIQSHPARELTRLFASALGARKLIEHERGWASVDRVWQELDRRAASWLRIHRKRVRAVYAYEDCAQQLFETAQSLGIRRIYDLPIAYWETSQKLLREEAARYPEWEPTLGGTRDSASKLERKRRELELAEMVICPSDFVRDSLPEETRNAKPCVVVPFGSPLVTQPNAPVDRCAGPLRILFAGALTQRKGLADLFAAMRLVRQENIELVVMGSLLQPLAWYRARCADFIYEPPRPHEDVLRLMRSCDVFVLPSIVEGRALVQQEAMACGLPVIATRNAGAADLIDDGQTGFLVPIRSPEAIAEKITWCAAHQERVAGMGLAAQARAAELTWRGYGEKVVGALRTLIGE